MINLRESVDWIRYFVRYESNSLSAVAIGFIRSRKSIDFTLVENTNKRLQLIPIINFQYLKIF